MSVDARGPPPNLSLTVHDKGPVFLVIVVTLVSIALLIFSLRAYTRGRLLRSFGIDDYLALVTALCLIGVLITSVCLVHLGFGRQSWSESSDNNISRLSSWIWVSTLLCIIAVGFVKLSIAFFLLRIFERRYCHHLLYAIICLLFALTLEWFGTTLLQCVPAAAAWNHSNQSKARCMSQSMHMTFSMVNNSINTGTDLMLVLLALPMACGPSLSLKNRALLIALLSLGSIACAAAVVRTQIVFNARKHDETDSIYDVSFLIWSVVELTAAIVATSLPTLQPLLTTLRESFRKRRKPTTIPSSSAPNTNHSSHQSRNSTQTVIYRPNTACIPTFGRFHDDESNLDFDIETPTTRTRTQTMRTRTTHSRNVSDWSQFSGFTYYTNPAEPPELDERMRSRSAGVSMTELEDIVKGLGLGRNVSGGRDVRPAITAMGGSTLPHERGDDVELTDLRRDIGDDEISSIAGCQNQEGRSRAGPGRARNCTA